MGVASPENPIRSAEVSVMRPMILLVRCSLPWVAWFHCLTVTLLNETRDSSRVHS